jgi:hypothetical protein
MLKVSTLLGAAASVGLANSAMLGLGLDSDDAALKAAGRADLASNAQIGNPDEFGVNFGAEVSANAGVADPDDFADEFERRSVLKSRLTQKQISTTIIRMRA